MASRKVSKRSTTRNVTSLASFQLLHERLEAPDRLVGEELLHKLIEQLHAAAGRAAEQHAVHPELGDAQPVVGHAVAREVVRAYLLGAPTGALG